ncbi:PD-(D/E)XK motif protein [Blastococcus sp. SYSU DS0539]
MTAPRGRHITPSTLGEYVAAGVLASIPIPGAPEAFLVVDAPNETLRLEMAWDGEEPPVINDYVHISTAVRFRNGTNWVALAVHGQRFFAEAYPLLCSVADLVQVDSLTFAAAVKQSLASYHDLLAATGHMPVSEEVGLYGELLVVLHLVSAVGPSTALSAWRGGDSVEEHDFGFPGDDVEVKTTTSESRRHWIGSLEQLEPTLGRPLWLLSVQVTGAGASEGRRLPDLIDVIADKLPPELRSVFDARLGATRYRPEQPRDSFRLLRLRSAPACFRVDDNFPVLTRGLLRNGGADVDRIRDVSYTVALDNMARAATIPKPLRGFAD